MLRKFTIKILWPPNWLRAYFRCKHKRKVSRVAEDPQLKLYDKILKTGFLHYAYFDDPEIPADKISLSDIRRGQIRYAELILEQITPACGTVLDVGCGMGGMISMLSQKGMSVVGLTPDHAQIDYIKQKYPQAEVIKTKFQKMQVEKYVQHFDTVIHSESLQYIDLQQAIKNVLVILKPKGRWIVLDYFRLCKAHEKSGHNWDNFLYQLEENNLRIVYSQDITKNISPTLKYLYMWGNEIGLPVYDFLVDKLKMKNPGKHFFVSDIVHDLEKMIKKNLNIINPDIFTENKKYVLMSIVRK
jgi:cyclopropane fatty-acyl-phospholipid synthase-like methyltransferase